MIWQCITVYMIWNPPKKGINFYRLRCNHIVFLIHQRVCKKIKSEYIEKNDQNISDRHENLTSSISINDSCSDFERAKLQ